MEFEKEKLRFDVLEDVTLTANVSAKEAVEEGWEVLAAEASACCLRAEMLSREAMAEGCVSFCIVLKDAEGHIRKVERNERFAVNEPMPGTDAKTVLLLRASAEKTRACVEAGNLMLSCRVVLSGVRVVPCETDVLAVPKDETVRCRQKHLHTDRVLFAMPLRFSHAFSVALSPRLPEAREVLCACASAYAQEVHLSAGQLVLGGKIALQTTYCSRDEYEPVLQVSDEEEFSQIVELTGSEEGGRAVVSLSVESVETAVCANAEGENRVIEVKAQLCGYALVVKSEETTAVIDAYALNAKLSCASEPIRFTGSLEPVSFSFSRSVSVRVPDGKPPVSRVNAVCFSPALTADAADGSVKGCAETAVLYMASGTGETEGFAQSIPIDFHDVFKPFDDEAEALLGQISLTDMQAVLISGREIEVRAGFAASFMPITREDCAPVRDIAEEESVPSEWGIILYRVQRGDTLWDICKQVCVDENDLLALNPGIS
ncbi:MAG: DUF3794 domain-containing protein, partial [Clostridia bacterium]|nr:DUF3794 domain-containing protein [Clostridia bacterium]